MPTVCPYLDYLHFQRCRRGYGATRRFAPRANHRSSVASLRINGAGRSGTGGRTCYLFHFPQVQYKVLFFDFSSNCGNELFHSLPCHTFGLLASKLKIRKTTDGVISKFFLILSIAISISCLTIQRPRENDSSLRG